MSVSFSVWRFLNLRVLYRGVDLKGQNKAVFCGFTISSSKANLFVGGVEYVFMSIEPYNVAMKLFSNTEMVMIVAIESVGIN